MARQLNEETHSVRLPKGLADQVRAATGQKLSPLVRTILTNLLDKYKQEQK
jgi:hypothetical protein